jgi:serine/threonine-protein kinase
MYELLTGKPPFGADSRDVRAIMWRAMSEPAPRPDCPDLPELADAIVRSMAKEPEERFPDAAEFAKTLRALIPDGASATLAMTVMAPAAGFASSSAVSSVAATSVLSELDTGSYSASVTGPGVDVDGTSGGRLRGVDETMVRPDRADPEPEPKSKKKRGGAAAGGAGGAAGIGAGGVGVASGGVDGEGRRRKRTPLIALVTLCLLGAAVWVVLDSQHSTTGPKTEPSSHIVLTVPTSASASHSASASPSPSATHTQTHSVATPSATTKVTHTASASASAAAPRRTSRRPPAAR